MILSKFQGDSVAIMSISTLNKINFQLEESQKILKQNKNSLFTISKQRKEILVLKDSINVQEKTIKRLTTNANQFSWQYERLNTSLKIQKRKVAKQKGIIIGGGVVSIGIIGFLLIFK